VAIPATPASTVPNGRARFVMHMCGMEKLVERYQLGGWHRTYRWRMIQQRHPLFCSDLPLDAVQKDFPWSATP